jgi:hypothetical protein
VRIPFVFTSETRTGQGLRRSWHMDHIDFDVPSISAHQTEKVRIAATLISGKQSSTEILGHSFEGQLYIDRKLDTKTHAGEWLPAAIAGRKGNFSGNPILPIAGLASLPVTDGGCVVEFSPFDGKATESDTREHYRQRALVYAADLMTVDGKLLSSSMEPVVGTLMKGENLGRQRWIGRLVLKDVHDLWRNRGFSHFKMQHGMVMPPFLDVLTQAERKIEVDFTAFTVEGNIAAWRPRLPEIDVNCFEALKWLFDEVTCKETYRSDPIMDKVLLDTSELLALYEDPTAPLPDPLFAGNTVLEAIHGLQNGTGALSTHLRGRVLRTQPTLERFAPYWQMRGESLAQAVSSTRSADPAEPVEEDYGVFRL